MRLTHLVNMSRAAGAVCTDFVHIKTILFFFIIKDEKAIFSIAIPNPNWSPC